MIPFEWREQYPREAIPSEPHCDPFGRTYEGFVNRFIPIMGPRLTASVSVSPLKFSKIFTSKKTDSAAI